MYQKWAACTKDILYVMVSKATTDTWLPTTNDSSALENQWQLSSQQPMTAQPSRTNDSSAQLSTANDSTVADN